MKRLLVIVACLYSPLMSFAAEPALFHLAVKDAPVENGKVLDMDFQEVTRAPEASTIVVTRRSGGSVSSSMFILRGMCGVARARGKAYFVPERIAGEGERYTATFSDTPPAPGKGFTMEQCELMHF